MKQRTRMLIALFMVIVMVLTMTVGQSAFAASKLGKVKGVKATVNVKKKKIKLTWKKVKGASGYAIQKNTKKKFKKIKAVNVKKNKKTFKKLKVGKTYYFKLRAFKKTKSGKKYGKATVKKVKMLKYSGSTTAVSTTVSTTQTTVATTVTTTQTTASTTAPTTKKPQIDIGNPTVATTIPRTTNADGNPTEAFINSLKGFTLKLLNPWEGPNLGTPAYEAAAEVEQAVETEFGVTIEEAGFYEGYDAALSASMSSGHPQAHIYRIRESNVANFLNRDYFLNLNIGMQQSGVDFTDPWYDQSATGFFNINNGQYAWGSTNLSANAIYYNKALVEKANLTDPKELVNDGTWTWDTLNQYSKKLTSSSVNGFIVMEHNPTILFKGMVASYGLSVTNVKTGSSPTTNIYDSTVKKCLTDIYNWVDKGYVTLGGGSWDAAKKEFGNGQAAMIYGSSDVLTNILLGEFGSGVGVVPFPKPSETDTIYYSSASVGYPFFVPYTYGDDAGKILFLNNEIRRQSYRYWQRDFVVNNSETFSGEDLEMLANISFSRENFEAVNDWSTLCETGSPTTSTIVNGVAKGAYTAQGAIDLYGQSLRTAYEDVWAGKNITGKVS